jgi:chaperonin cofactor prefoldin
MSNVQLDVNKIVESLVNQISQQAQRIAVLEATIDAIQKAKQEVTDVSDKTK